MRIDEIKRFPKNACKMPKQVSQTSSRRGIVLKARKKVPRGRDTQSIASVAIKAIPVAIKTIGHIYQKKVFRYSTQNREDKDSRPEMTRNIRCYVYAEFDRNNPFLI